MTIPEYQLYPRTGDKQTIYLKNAITNPNILVGDYTMYNDFVNDPTLFKETSLRKVRLRSGVFYRIPCNKKRMAACRVSIPNLLPSSFFPS